MSTMGSRLVKARTNAGLTQSEVAEKLHVTAQAISLWERDENAPDIMKLPDLSELYKVTIDWLVAGREPDQALLEITKHLSDRLFDEEKMYTYIKAYATAKGLYQTVSVLPYVREKHAGQFRKGEDKVPYINHPLLMACHAISLGLCEDDLLSAALLHDVSEDCGVPIEDLPVNDETKEAVALLTKDFEALKKSEEAVGEYYRAISENRIAAIVKLLDRCNNVSGMATCFPDKKIANYIMETEQYIYPLMDKTADLYPECQHEIFLIKYHTTSVVEAIRHEMARQIK
ncbi:MAG: helix-turn-helix domain-containing protein [Lachnospiraceae bacterium]|nr:helix-turn-helix domain-containing protein [Lachnospiraceae bacterium]